MTVLAADSPSVLLTNAQMARADALTVESGTPGRRLMENAGQAVVEELLKERRPERALVLAGPGNNGGDGFVVARLLAEHGIPVDLALLGARDKLKGDAALAAADWQGRELPFEPGVVDGQDVIVDGVFGAGLTRDVDGPVAAVIAAANQADALRVAIDVPTGVSGDTGAVLGTGLQADLTVTFFRAKSGHLLLPGFAMCGRTVVRDIGIDDSVLRTIAPQSFDNRLLDWRPDLPTTDVFGHKYGRGHAVVVGGRVPTLGAARLAAVAALRSGAGLVTLAAPAETYAIQATALTDVMVAPFKDVAALDALLGDPRRNCLVAGPGLGTDAQGRETVLAVLGQGRAAVLDADALTAFADDPEALCAAIDGPSVLTPHGGEFARLFGEAGPDKLTATRRAAERSGAVVVHKGPDTVIAAPDGSALIDTEPLPQLATAGSGDVLSGIVAGLLARGGDALTAAAVGVRLHRLAARGVPSNGAIASDLTAALPDGLERFARGPL